VPRSKIEIEIVEAIAKTTSQTVLDVFTKENHPYFDQEERDECTADYIVHTSELYKGLFIGKREYFVWLNQGQIDVELYSSYI